jgi:hypothetical protein
MLPCSWKEHFGIECPTCGFQRSFLELIQGNFFESLMLFPAILPLLFTIFILLFHLTFKFKHGAKYIIISFSLSTATIVFNYIVVFMHQIL